MVEKTTIFERKAIVSDWADLMGNVDRALANLIHEDSMEERQRMLKEFEKNLEELGTPKFSTTITIPMEPGETND